MFTIDIEQFTPKFILADKNGYALARALEAGLNRMNAIVKQGVDCLSDYNTMPEWRLDELAWEYNILYDYNAEIATKREWIANATQFYNLYGTPRGIVQYLEAVFDTVNLEEWWQYNADPFHFRVTVTGEWSETADDWAKKAVAMTQNVRSVLDNIIFNSGGATIPLKVAAAIAGIDIADEITMLE